MSLYKNWSTDSKKESEGVEVPFEANEDGSVPTFIISRQGESNKEFVKALDQATKPYRRQIQLGTMNKDKDAEIFREVFASTIVRGWRNIQDENGNDFPYSKVNAVKLFTDLPELYKELQNQSATAALFRNDALEAEAKN